MGEHDDENLELTIGGKPWSIRWSTADRLCRFIVKWGIYILLASGAIFGTSAGLDAVGVVDMPAMDFMGE